MKIKKIVTIILFLLFFFNIWLTYRWFSINKEDKKEVYFYSITYFTFYKEPSTSFGFGRAMRLLKRPIQYEDLKRIEIHLAKQDPNKRNPIIINVCEIDSFVRSNPNYESLLKAQEE